MVERRPLSTNWSGKASVRKQICRNLEEAHCERENARAKALRQEKGLGVLEEQYEECMEVDGQVRRGNPCIWKGREDPDPAT